MSFFEKLMTRRGMAVLISLGLLGLAFSQAGVQAGFEQLKRMPLEVLLLSFAVLALNLFVVGFRFWRTLSHFGIRLPWVVASRATMAGHAAGLVIISLFGQVAGRQAILRHEGVSPIVNASLAAYERAVLAILSGSLAAAGAAYLLDAASIHRFLGALSLSEVMAAAGSGALLSYYLGAGTFEKNLTRRLLSWKNVASLLEIAGITLLSQGLLLLVYAFGINVFSPELGWPSIFAAAAIISFAASMPISVNGWGLREVAAVYVLGTLGVPAASALAVSIMLGLCSTLVILGALPFSLGYLHPQRSESAVRNVPAAHVIEGLERAAALILGMLCSVAVFFQSHVTLNLGVINVNLADPFAILSLAAVLLNCIHHRTLPAWKLASFNRMLALISVILLFGFAHGVLEIGVTQWALGGRVLGWLIVLGYVSAGYLIVSTSGRHGLRRFVETLSAVAVAVVSLQIVIRLLQGNGLLTDLSVPLNFEGYAANRNAFAFQLLAVIALLLGYSPVYARVLNHGFRPVTIIRSLLFPIVLCGLVLTASRAGWAVAVLMLGHALVNRPATRTPILFTLLIAGVILYIVTSLGETRIPGQMIPVMSVFSPSLSNHERLESVFRGLELWRDSPVLGIGLGVFIEKSLPWFKAPMVIHSTPVWVLVEFGLAGIALMAWWGLRLVREARVALRCRHSGYSVFLLVAAFLLFGLAHEIFFQRIFWLVLGALLAQPYAVRTDPESRPTA